MNWLIYVGFVISVMGLGGVLFCLLKAVGIRRFPQPGDRDRRSLQQLVPFNLLSVLLAMLGLLLVVVGLLL